MSDVAAEVRDLRMFLDEPTAGFDPMARRESGSQVAERRERANAAGNMSEAA